METIFYCKILWQSCSIQVQGVSHFFSSTLYCISLCPPLPQFHFEENLTENHSSYICKQIIPHILALDGGLKISQAQLCTFIRGCHATFLVKNTLFKGEVAWQPLKELQICSSSILDPPTKGIQMRYCLSFYYHNFWRNERLCQKMMISYSKNGHFMT